MAPRHRLAPDPGDGARPAANSWNVVGLAADPTPGDGAGISILSSGQRDRADTVDRARNKVISLLSNESLMGWIGASGRAFWEAAEPFPSQLALLHDSYTALSQAFDTYSTAVSLAQSRADSARYRAQSTWHALGLDPGPLDLDTNSFRGHVGHLISTKGLEDAHPDAFSTLSQARTEVDEASTDFDRATQRCVTAIEQAADNAARAIRLTGGVSFDDRFRSLGGNLVDLVFVAHDGPGLDSASAAKRDAEWLRQALANPDDPWSKALLDLAGQDLAAHSTDTDFLQAFFADGGAQDVADVSRLLAPPGGPALSQDTKNLLEQYAGATAAASWYADMGLVKLPAGAFDPLSGGEKLDYPAAALLAYGPTGDMWGHTLLSTFGQQILIWTDAHNGYDPTNGLTPDIMLRVSQNPQACRDLLDPQLLSDPSRAADNYKALLQSWWLLSDQKGQPGVDGSHIAASIIQNATTDVTGYPDQSRQAAAALFTTLDGTKLPPALALAVANTGAAHLDSLMRDSPGGMVGGGSPVLPDGQIPLTQEQLDNALKSFAADKTAPDALSHAIAIRALETSQHGVFAIDGNSPDDNHLKALGALQGRLDLNQQQAGVDKMHAQDHVNTLRQAWIQAAFGSAGAMPLPHGEVPFQMAAGAAGSLTTPFFEHLLPTDQGDAAVDAAQYSLSAKSSALDVPIVQGLINRGEATPPPDALWIKNGIVDISTPDARNTFNDWLYDQAPDQARQLSGIVTDGYDKSGMQWKIK